MNLGKYSKTIAAIIAYVLAWAAQVVASAPHAITSAEWLALAGGIAVAAGVYGATNTSPPPPTSANATCAITGVHVGETVRQCGVDSVLAENAIIDALKRYVQEHGTHGLA